MEAGRTCEIVTDLQWTGPHLSSQCGMTEAEKQLISLRGTQRSRALPSQRRFYWRTRQRNQRKSTSTLFFFLHPDNVLCVWQGALLFRAALQKLTARGARSYWLKVGGNTTKISIISLRFLWMHRWEIQFLQGLQWLITLSTHTGRLTSPCPPS